MMFILHQRYTLTLSLITFWLLLLSSALITGCASTPRPDATFESTLLPKPEAVIEIGEIKTEGDKKFDIDAESMLKEALEKAFTKQGLLRSNEPEADRFIFSAEVVDYEMGSAFKRWLLPNYGSTILAVRGELRDAQDNTLAGTVTHKRSVVAGGAFTIGAWKTIFQSVADDIAKELKLRIYNPAASSGKNSGIFVVNISPRSEKDVDVPIAEKRLKLKINALEDRRFEKEKIGERYAAFGVPMGDIFLNRNVSNLLYETISDELRAAGHTMVDTGQDFTVEGEVLKFWVETETTLLYWDVVGVIEIKLTVESSLPGMEILEKSYTTRQVERTYVWPTRKLVTKVLEACLEDLLNKVRSDNVWGQAL